MVSQTVIKHRSKRKIKVLIALRSSLWSSQSQWLELIDTKGSRENLEFALVYVKQWSQTDNEGFLFTVGTP